MCAKKHTNCTLIMWGLVLLLILSGCAGDKVDSTAGKGEFHIPQDDFATANLQGEDLEDRFSLTESLYRLEQVEDIFVSFRELTEECRDKLSPDLVAALGNTSWEMQHLGFNNLPRTIEGTLLWQDYQIKKLEYALALERYEGDKTSAQEVEEAQAAYNDGQDKMQEFLNHFVIAD